MYSMKQYVRILLGGLMVMSIGAVPLSLYAATSAPKKVATTNKMVIKKANTTKKKTVIKKIVKKKKGKKKKEILNLNPPLIDPSNPPGGR